MYRGDDINMLIKGKWLFGQIIEVLENDMYRVEIEDSGDKHIANKSVLRYAA